MNNRFNLGWDHLRGHVSRAWGGILGSTNKLAIPKVSPELSASDAEKVQRLMDDCLAARGGEVSSRQRAAVLGELYLTLNETGRLNFFKVLIEHFGVDQQSGRTAAQAVVNAPDDQVFQQATSQMRAALVSSQQRLLRQFTALPQGIKFLVDMRADVLSFRARHPELSALDHDLKTLLATWFDVGLLTVERISWQSSAALLEKLIAYEAVHAISSWTDLHNRLESDRRCYAFFHPGMSDEPLIFIEVALVEGMATSIQELLDEDAPTVDPENADTAIFYSISNTQRGLQGISFGSFLIKQVVTSLRQQLPHLKTFSTLSPIPGFRRWLSSYIEASVDMSTEDPALLALEDAARILQVENTLEAIFDSPAWWKNQDVAELLREPMLSLCARFLHETREKDQAPLDPVARFHLGNGARIERLNWLGDTSPKGMHESCGLMVNYLYQLKDIEKNIEAYTTDKAIASAGRVRNLLRNDENEMGQLTSLRKLLSLGRGNGQIE